MNARTNLTTPLSFFVLFFRTFYLSRGAVAGCNYYIHRAGRRARRADQRGRDLVLGADDEGGLGGVQPIGPRLVPLRAGGEKRRRLPFPSLPFHFCLFLGRRGSLIVLRVKHKIPTETDGQTSATLRLLTFVLLAEV